MNLRNSIILGAFVLACLGGLLWAAIVLSGISLEKRQTRIAYFGKNALVEKGVEILTSGTAVGRVDDVSLVPDDEIEPGKYVMAVLSLEKDLTLWKSRAGVKPEARARVRIVPRSALGGHLIQLERGPPDGEPLGPDETLVGEMTPGLVDSLTRLVLSNEAKFDKIVDDLSIISGRLIKGEGTIGKLFTEDTLYNELSRTASDLSDIINDVRAGEGALGALLRDKEMRSNVRETFANVREISERLRLSDNTLGRLLNDATLGRDMETLVKSANEIARGLRDGEGVVGMLLSDDDARRNLFTTIKDLRDLTTRLREGEGTLQLLMNDPGLYQEFRTVAANLAGISDDIRAGRGTLGKLMMDEALYDEARLMLASFREGSEITRENAPLATVVTFSAFLFTVLN